MPQQETLGKHATQITASATPGWVAVTYQQVVVVEFSSDFVKLNSGGRQTLTAKTRMCQASTQFNLGYAVKSVRGQWRVLTATGVFAFEDNMWVRRQDGACFVVVDGATVELHPLAGLKGESEVVK